MSNSTRNSGKGWTPQEVAQIKELVKHNTPTRVVGLKLGRTPAAIYNKASQEGISLEPHNRSPYGTTKKK
jgi:hypothetical protein